MTIITKMDPTAIVPTPYYDFCDQKERFCVAGFGLKTKPDSFYIFLYKKRCVIYKSPTSICIIYSHMLNKEADESDKVDLR